VITPADMAVLEALPLLAFHAALVFCRLAAAVMLLPGLGEAEIPVNVRLALGVLLVFVLTPVLSPVLPPLPGEVGPLALLVGQEVMIGVWIGLMARFVALGLAQAGQVIALMVGLASPLQGDQVLGSSATAPARMFALATAALFLATGLYEVPLRALANSYATLPAGGGLPLGDAAEMLTRFAAGILSVAMQLAAPFVLAAIFFNAAMGLLARVAPQLQVFIVAAPAQLLGGFLLLILLMPAMFHAWWQATGEALSRLPGAG
jgi:flagellar biosynthetic protein FliR